MSTSSKKIEANRMNAQKSEGPHDTTSTRFNALKHGLLAMGITELDVAEGYQEKLSDLTSEKDPRGVVETFLVKSIVLDIVRWARARRLEAEYITAALNPPLYEKDWLDDFDSKLQGSMRDQGIPAALGAGQVQSLVTIFQRYETFFANRLTKMLRELEHMQRIRPATPLPGSTGVDAAVTAKIAAADLTPATPQQAKDICGGGERPERIIMDVIKADSDVLDSPSADEKPVPPADDETLTAVAGVALINREKGSAGLPPAGQSGPWSSTPPAGPIWMK